MNKLSYNFIERIIFHPKLFVIMAHRCDKSTTSPPAPLHCTLSVIVTTIIVIWKLNTKSSARAMRLIKRQNLDLRVFGWGREVVKLTLNEANGVKLGFWLWRQKGESLKDKMKNGIEFELQSAWKQFLSLLKISEISCLWFHLVSARDPLQSSFGLVAGEFFFFPPSWRYETEIFQVSWIFRTWKNN